MVEGRLVVISRKSRQSLNNRIILITSENVTLPPDPGRSCVESVPVSFC